MNPNLLQNEMRPLETRQSPTLFRQIASRLAIFTLFFALLDIGIVIFTYSQQPQSLAEELLTMEAEKIESRQVAEAEQFAGPPGASRWFASYVDGDASSSENGTLRQPSPNAGTLMDWTRREELAQGFRISGVRSVVVGGDRRWLFMQFEGRGIRPYVPVIANELLQHVALPLVPLSVLMLLFNILAVRRVLNPLRRAEADVDRLDPENMALRISEPTEPREVATLVRAVNRALERLEESMGILRSFTANAAHELRTPLSIMQLALDELPSGRQREELLADNRQMTRLVNQMLDLAQADAKAFETGARVDLADVGRKAVAQLASVAFNAGSELSFADFGEAVTKGHEEAIFRIYRNLIDNALVHAPDGTLVEVSAGPGPQLCVRDHGPGIAAEDIPQIFDRFWRKNRQDSVGAGLGLGIVQRLAQAHGGTVIAENAPDGGAIFTVSFPQFT
ncbi:HAMP domain-containing sensor histidine kinase [Allopontixanthobacter sediminis]|uniref:HAMP domain-containing sensor histidine kinase n=1 Tax=Allopontixanthobacter sediminis TaxID=1689985 RepID=UPI001E5015C2|nr:HAMP domain-containing sensor histidine kinase [Allopontixanthobacter sediminis]